MFSDFMWKKIFAPGNSRGRGEGGWGAGAPLLPFPYGPELRLISKFMASQTVKQMIKIYILPNISKSKDN